MIMNIFAISGRVRVPWGHPAARSCFGLLREIVNDYGAMVSSAILVQADLDTGTRRDATERTKTVMAGAPQSTTPK